MNRRKFLTDTTQLALGATILPNVLTGDVLTSPEYCHYGHKFRHGDLIYKKWENTGLLESDNYRLDNAYELAMLLENQAIYCSHIAIDSFKRRSIPIMRRVFDILFNLNNPSKATIIWGSSQKDESNKLQLRSVFCCDKMYLDHEVEYCEVLALTVANEIASFIKPNHIIFVHNLSLGEPYAICGVQYYKLILNYACVTKFTAPKQLVHS